ncbi:hypothetical protein AGMMS49532_08510 [Endomicrobiia bacterium]|nr:hypothetical protein AGMMS49532_08510 [Endomicrobiia bacterium]
MSTSLIVKAVDYKNENGMLDLSKQMTVLDMSFNGEKIGEKSIILGSELAKNIAVSVGNKVVLMFPSNFSSIPKMYEFTVSAVIQSGMYDFDYSLGFIDLEEGQKLFSVQNEITGFDIHINNFDKAVTAALQKDLSYPYRVKTWIEMNKNLFSALKLEKIMMFLILGLIILVAAFNIVFNLLLLSVQKSKEIGIMSAMGFSKFSISKIFFYEGLIVGSSGTVLGIMSGLAMSFLLKYFNIFKLPISIIPADIIMIAACAFIITVTAGIYPAYQVSKLDPLEAIRYG